MAPQTNALQLVVVPGAQVPAPSQYRTPVAAPAMHCATAQTLVDDGGAAHLVVVVPSHVAWQAPEPRHAVLAPRGLPPAGTATH